MEAYHFQAKKIKKKRQRKNKKNLTYKGTKIRITSNFSENTQAISGMKYLQC